LDVVVVVGMYAKFCIGGLEFDDYFDEVELVHFIVGVK